MDVADEQFMQQQRRWRRVTTEILPLNSTADSAMERLIAKDYGDFGGVIKWGEAFDFLVLKSPKIFKASDSRLQILVSISSCSVASVGQALGSAKTNLQTAVFLES